MDFLAHFLLGLFMSVAALLLPGMVNMGAVGLSARRGLSAGLWFGLGAALVMLVQAYLAVAFAGFLGRHPGIFVFLERAAVVLFFGLSFLFWYLARRPRQRSSSSRQGRPFLIGALMAAMNALNIPFFFTATTFLRVEGLVLLSQPQRWWLLLGAFAGALLMLGGYVLFARYIARRTSEFSRYVYLVLSGFFLILAFAQLVSLYYEA